MTDLAGAHAVVTGGSSGIGRATASLLVERGARVSLVARGRGRLDETAAELRATGGTVATATADVADADGLVAAVDALTTELGPCDVLVTSAGGSRPGYFEQLDDEVFHGLMAVNYFGTLNAIRAVVPSMIERGRGSIVGVSSAAGLIGVFGFAAYTPTKFAVRGLLETLRAELAPHGVHVGCAFPPDVDTPMLADENRYKPEETKAISAAIRPISPERVAASIVRGIEQRRFSIIPDWQTRLLARTAGLVPEAFAYSFDRTARRAHAGR